MIRMVGNGGANADDDVINIEPTYGQLMIAKVFLILSLLVSNFTHLCHWGSKIDKFTSPTWLSVFFTFWVVLLAQLIMIIIWTWLLNAEQVTREGRRNIRRARKALTGISGCAAFLNIIVTIIF